MGNDNNEVLSPAISVVDSQIKKLRMSMDRTGSSKAKGDCNIVKVEGSNDMKELLSTFMKKKDTYCGKMAMKGRLERFMTNVTSKIDRRQQRKGDVMNIIELQLTKLSTGSAGPNALKDLQTVIEDMMQLAEGIGSAQKEYVMLCNITTLIEEMPTDNHPAKLKSAKGETIVLPEITQNKAHNRSRNRHYSKGPSISITRERTQASPSRFSKKHNDCVKSSLTSRNRSQCTSKLDSHNRSVLKEWTETVSSMFLGDCSTRCNVVNDTGMERWRTKLYRLIKNAIMFMIVAFFFCNILYVMEPFHVYRNGSPVV